MFEKVELPATFAGKPICVGDKFRYKPNGMMHTVLFNPKKFAFQVFKDNVEDGGNGENIAGGVANLIKNAERWERA